MGSPDATLAWLGTSLTVAFAVFFAGWVWWAYSPNNRERLEKAGQLPLQDGDE